MIITIKKPIIIEFFKIKEQTIIKEINKCNDLSTDEKNLAKFALTQIKRLDLELKTGSCYPVLNDDTKGAVIRLSQKTIERFGMPNEQFSMPKKYLSKHPLKHSSTEEVINCLIRDILPKAYQR
jgi:hypothetical protein